MGYDPEAPSLTCAEADALHERMGKLEDALRAFLLLSWAPDAAPGPSCYMVEPVHEARNAMKAAGMLLDGKSPFPADNNGSVMTFPGGKRAVWLDGMAYDEDRRDRVPEKHLATFDAALSAHEQPSGEASAVHDDR